MNVQAAPAKLESFKAYVRKMKQYEEAIALIYWDMRTGAPKKGLETVPKLSESCPPKFSGCLHRMRWAVIWTSSCSLPNWRSLDAISRKMVQECKKDYDRSKKIPAEKYQAYVVLTSQAESAWEDAKHNSDWASFQPYLEKIVAATQEFIELWGYEGHKYNTLLDMYEPGMTVRN